MRALADLYHARWGIAEMYKLSKQMLAVEPFHGHSERLVRQELCAHFRLLAMTRLFAKHSEGGFRSAPGKPALQANFRTALGTVGRHLEGLFLLYADTLGKTVSQILDRIGGCRQRRRPDRFHPRTGGRRMSTPTSCSQPNLAIRKEMQENRLSGTSLPGYVLDKKHGSLN